jgi:hypothetical protein
LQEPYRIVAPAAGGVTRDLAGYNPRFCSIPTIGDDATRSGTGEDRYEAALGGFAVIIKAVEHFRHLHRVRLGISVTVSTSLDWQSGQVIVPDIRAS